MPLTYRDDILHMDSVPLPALAEQYGTPLYVYSRPALMRAVHEIDKALHGPTPYLICYAVKANPTLAIIQTFARFGFGADVTSGGELYRAIQAGVPARRIVYSGVGKTPAEMREALDAGIRAFHIESEGELDTLAFIAEQAQRTVAVTFRTNPDIDPHTHPHIVTGLRTSKFGLSWDSIPALVSQVLNTPSLRLVGLSAHIGSQITTLAPFAEAAGRLSSLARDLLAQGVRLEYLDFGGGLGIQYGDESPPSLAEWGTTLRSALGDLPLNLLVEPGRALVAEAGVLLTRVLSVKHTPEKIFVIVDAGMNDLLRPMLYDAYHPIWPIRQWANMPQETVDVVGPICESTDVLARDRLLTLPRPGDLLAILNAGAYGMSMASNYNSRRRPAEVMVRLSAKHHLIRARESYADLTRGESLLPL